MLTNLPIGITLLNIEFDASSLLLVTHSNKTLLSLSYGLVTLVENIHAKDKLYLFRDGFLYFTRLVLF